MKYAKLTAQVGQDDIAYIDHGQGPVLVCMHAIGHAADDYGAMIATLSDRYRFIAVDFPGHGASSVGTQLASADYYASVTQALLAQLGIESCILLGNSIGGAAALIVAEHMPATVKALVLCNPGGIFERSEVTQRAAMLFSRVFAQGEKQAVWFKAFFSMYYRLVLKNPAAKIRRKEITELAYECARVNREAWQSFAASDSDLRQRARQLPQPMLVAWATQDRVNRLGLNLPTIRTLRHAVLKTYRAGHSAFLECPEQFNQDFNAFVRSENLVG